MDKEQKSEMCHGHAAAEPTQNCPPAEKWAAVVNDQHFPMPRRKLVALDVKEQAGVEADFLLVRDYSTPHDVVLEDDSPVDLAEGNVFRLVARCEATSGAPCTGVPKLAFACNDAWAVTLIAEQTEHSLKRLFNLPEDAEISRDYESPHDVAITSNEQLHFKDGPVFLSKAKPCHAKFVKITINRVEKEITAGTHTVAELKRLGGVDAGDELVQVIDQKTHPLANDASVEICGGEVFISHPCRGTSS
jgi:hypothetical protein